MTQVDTTPERFWNSFSPEPMSGCWIWTSFGRKEGYGEIWVTGDRNRLAYRYAYELLKGKVPVGLELDHLCRNRACVNPDHLEAVTPRENARRGMSPHAQNARKTHCSNNHPLPPKGRDRHGRVCRICANARNRRWEARKQTV